MPNQDQAAVEHERGWHNMVCWNGLSADQQRRLTLGGYLPISYEPEGKCLRGADLYVETQHDETPGPRYYCRSCAIAYLMDGDKNSIT